jgi:hypothetical protein
MTETAPVQDKKALRDTVLGLGMLLSAFHGLEFMVRGFLYMRESVKTQRFPRGHDIYANAVDTLVLLNAFTDYRSLGPLIDSYNKYVLGLGHDRFKIDPEVVPIRDALAHGRVSTPGNTETFYLIKYDRPTKDDPSNVRVSYRVTVNYEWLHSQAIYVQNQMMRVCEAHEALP